MTQIHKVFDWIIFWLFLIPGTVFSVFMSGDCIKHLVDESVLFSRNPWLVIALGAVFGILSILGICSIILFLMKKRWEAVAFVTAVCGALFWGYEAVENVPLSFLPIVTKLFYVLASIWCIFVAGYNYKRITERGTARRLFWLVLVPSVLITGTIWGIWGGLSNPANRKTIGEISAPAGYERVEVQKGSFGSFVRNFPLQRIGSKMEYYDGSIALLQYLGYAVLDLPLISDSEQCCDAVQRMRSEYLFSKKRYSDIHFKSFENGTMRYSGGGDRKALYTFLRKVYGSSNTSTLRHELKKKNWEDIAPGDVLVYEADSHHKVGHAVLVVDVAVNHKTGKKAIMVAQSSMPALTMHVLRNIRNPFKSPWFIIDKDQESFRTTVFSFSKDDLRTW